MAALLGDDVGVDFQVTIVARRLCIASTPSFRIMAMSLPTSDVKRCFGKACLARRTGRCVGPPALRGSLSHRGGVLEGLGAAESPPAPSRCPGAFTATSACSPTSHMA